MALSKQALQNPMVRNVARAVVKNVLRSDAKSVQFWLRWGMTRARAAPRMKGLVRGTAIAWPEPGRAFTVHQDLPKPGRGQVLILAKASAVSPGTERAFFVRARNTSPTFPFFPGYSLAGEVIAAGKGLPFRSGDTVAVAASHASLAMVNADLVHPVPDGVTAETASLVELGLIAVNALEQSGVAPGDDVVVFGQGIIGQLLVQLAVAKGANSVVSVARTDRRVSAGLKAKAQEIFILERDGTDVLSGLDASVVLDATGQPDAVPLSLVAVRPGGTIVIAGSPREATQETDFGELADKQVTILGAHAGRLLQPADQESRARAAEYVETFFRLAAEQRLDLESLISARVHPWEADWFYRRLAGTEDATLAAVFNWELLSPDERMKRVSYLRPPDLTPITGARKIGQSS